MSWQQVKAFDAKKMGTKKGWCLMNCRLGFGIPTGHYPSAKADMQAQRANGTFHNGSNVPTNVAVPVYVDTSSPYEHVMVLDHGRLYSDGRVVAGGLSGFKVFGWGECCDSVRVVKWVDTPATGFLPAKGYWTLGDKDARIGGLAKFMRDTFPAYTPAAALGNLYGKFLMGSIKEFQRRAKAAGRYNDAIDGMTGPKTYAALKSYGFKG